MTQNRRDFLWTSSLALAGAFAPGIAAGQQPAAQAPAAAAPPPTTPVFTPVRRNVGTFFARGGTMGWLIAPDAVVVIDSQFADTSQLFLDGLKPRTQRKIDMLINTHHHPDHTGGNLVLKPSVAKIVAHENVPGLQRKQAAAQKSEANQAYADVTFKDTWKTDAGNEVISIKHYGPGHTGGDAVIFFERANIVHMGDLMSHLRHPRADRPAGASIRNWATQLEQVVKDHNNDTVYIFGHAKANAPVTGSRADLLKMRDYFTALLDYTQKGIAAGRSVEEMTKAGVPGFMDYEGTATALQAAYDELKS